MVIYWLQNARNFSPLPESTPFAMGFSNFSQDEGESIPLIPAGPRDLLWSINCAEVAAAMTEGKSPYGRL